MGDFTLQTSLTWFFSALRTFPKLLKKMKIVILLFAVLATINAAALQNAKAADEPAAVKAADIPKPAKVEDKLAAEEDMAETQEDEGEDDMAETREDEGDDPVSYCNRYPGYFTAACRRKHHLHHQRWCRHRPHHYCCRHHCSSRFVG